MSSRDTLLSFDLSKCFYIDTQGGTAVRHHHDITHYLIGGDQSAQRLWLPFTKRSLFF